MKLYFFRGEHPNFGDELNNWLMPMVFPSFFDEDDSTRFLGIGSVLYDNHPPLSTKIVFGAGYGGYRPPPQLDETWKIYCVRGPGTAATLKLSPDKIAGDAAILINRYREKPVAKSIACSFMPHWESLYRGHWESACKIAGITYLNPRMPVEQVLAKIEASKMVITEAMHGAIVADALRVPWVPILPFHPSHHYKWYDWADALDLSLKPRKLWPSSLIEARLLIRGKGTGTLDSTRGVKKLAAQIADGPLTVLAAAGLRRASHVEPSLSSNVAMDRVVSRLEESAHAILRDYR